MRDANEGFPARTPIEFISMDILGLLPKRPIGSQLVQIIGDRFSNLTCAVYTSETKQVLSFQLLSSMHRTVPDSHLVSKRKCHSIHKKVLRNYLYSSGTETPPSAAYQHQMAKQVRTNNGALKKIAPLRGLSPPEMIQIRAAN